MESVQHRTIETNGIKMHIAEKGSGPLVLLLHGFPELWYSWRHQILALADSGYHAVAPDLRGYGDTDAPQGVDNYTYFHIVGDLIGLLNALGEEKVFVAGHDWGALTAWYLCLFRPDRVKALVNLSVQFTPRNLAIKPVDLMRKAFGDDYYVCRFQEPGKAEAELADTEKSIKTFLTYRKTGPPIFPDGLFESWSAPDTLPAWLSEEELRYYVDKFQKSGFTGGLNYYRNLNRNWELLAPWQGSKIMVPTKFVVGDEDVVYTTPGAKEYIHGDCFKSDVPLLEEIVIIEGAGHFITQERPNEVSQHILDFINKFQVWVDIEKARLQQSKETKRWLCFSRINDEMSILLDFKISGRKGYGCQIREGSLAGGAGERERVWLVMESIQHRTIETNGIKMHIAEKGSGPLVLLLHGFPELWYTWRHQILALADDGYHALAPDLRGYGDTDAPQGIDNYTCFHIVGDLIGLLNALGEEKVFVIGHDWGAVIAWYLCLFRPDRVKALVNLSVHFTRRNPDMKPVDLMRKAIGDGYYICRFQEPGLAEAEFADTEKTMRSILTYRNPAPPISPSGTSLEGSPAPPISPSGTSLEVSPSPQSLPDWLSEEDVQYYAQKFKRSGFTGGLNYYRNLNRNWELLAPWSGAKITIPTKFIVGELDMVYNAPGAKDYIHKGGFKSDVPFLHDIIVVNGAGHFINQERPHEISHHILDFIKRF
ncbi:uncharacterized protein LOC116262697 [Nymphaea colorata]|nr:uncharacterized protein LOC116262697 [Nymphaea colorata]